MEIREKRKQARIRPSLTTTLMGSFVLLLFVSSPLMSHHHSSPAQFVSAEPYRVYFDNLEPAYIPVRSEHVETPRDVKSVYMSAWVAGTPNLREKLVDFVVESDLNSITIDIKDSTGAISFPVQNPAVAQYGTYTNRIPDIHNFIQELHDKDVYVIGRLTMFQDPLLAEKRPDLAYKRTDTGEIWKDRKGLAFIHPRSTEVLDYLTALAVESYAIGFDEINFDYIRFPSDGDMSVLDYDLGEEETRTEVMKQVYEHLDTHLRQDHAIPISADLFGMTTTATDDLSIGQVLVDALPYFDAIAPMVYPSHYPDGYLGHQNPADFPYEIIHHTIGEGVKRAESIGENPEKIRAWIQDFDLGADYGTHEVQEQIRALEDLGLYSFMSWDPRNAYSKLGYYNLPERPNEDHEVSRDLE
jgi:hypothetical protein